MSYNNGIHTCKKRILSTAAILGVAAAVGLSACGGPNWLADLKAGGNPNALSPHEKARIGRTKAVDHAAAALQEAKAAGAERAAPYEFYTAEEYLNLSVEELKSGDVIGVGHFAAESEKYSSLAMEKTKGGSK